MRGIEGISRRRSRRDGPARGDEEGQAAPSGAPGGSPELERGPGCEPPAGRPREPPAAAASARGVATRPVETDPGELEGDGRLPGELEALSIAGRRSSANAEARDVSATVVLEHAAGEARRMLKGILHTTTSSDWPKAVLMENEKVLLMRDDGGPNRVVASRAEAEELAGPLRPYTERPNRRPDDGWHGEQRFSPKAWADIEARSAAHYNRPARDTSADSAAKAPPKARKSSRKASGKAAAAKA